MVSTFCHGLSALTTWQQVSSKLKMLFRKSCSKIVSSDENGLIKWPINWIKAKFPNLNQIVLSERLLSFRPNSYKYVALKYLLEIAFSNSLSFNLKKKFNFF